jgi:hypothetical protein
MALLETTKVDQIEVTQLNTIQVRIANIIEKDGIEISKTYQRHVLAPGEDVSNEDPKVQAVANAVWTEEVIAAYQALIANNNI